MTTFGKAGGIYERAKTQFRLADGKAFFQYSFFDQNRLGVLPFYADLHKQAVRSRPSPGHFALAGIGQSGKMLRHYTMNIDGLAKRAGMEEWDRTRSNRYSTIELHGNLFNLVCPACGHAEPLTNKDLKLMYACRTRECTKCCTNLRPKVLNYDDAEAEHITPRMVLDLMKADSQVFARPSIGRGFSASVRCGTQPLI